LVAQVIAYPFLWTRFVYRWWKVINVFRKC
jgi:hypothetical protein